MDIISLNCLFRLFKNSDFRYLFGVLLNQLIFGCPNIGQPIINKYRVIKNLKIALFYFLNYVCIKKKFY